jgi:hypothetical protein
MVQVKFFSSGPYYLDDHKSNLNNLENKINAFFAGGRYKILKMDHKINELKDENPERRADNGKIKYLYTAMVAYEEKSR